MGLVLGRLPDLAVDPEVAVDEGGDGEEAGHHQLLPHVGELHVQLRLHQPEGGPNVN